MRHLPKIPIGFYGKLKHENDGVANFLMRKNETHAKRMHENEGVAKFLMHKNEGVAKNAHRFQWEIETRK